MKKLLAAISEGKFKNEILSVEINGETLSVDGDLGNPIKIRLNLYPQLLMKKGTITAATSSPISIGASAMIIMDEEKQKK